MALQECRSRGEDPAKGVPGGAQENTYGFPGDDNCGDKGVVRF